MTWNVNAPEPCPKCDAREGKYYRGCAECGWTGSRKGFDEQTAAKAREVKYPRQSA